MSYSNFAELLLSSQRALLGAIGSSVLAVRVREHPQQVELTVFAEGPLSDEEREDLEVATTEMTADQLEPVIPVCLTFVLGEPGVNDAEAGTFVYLRRRG